MNSKVLQRAIALGELDCVVLNCLQNIQVFERTLNYYPDLAPELQDVSNANHELALAVARAIDFIRIATEVENNED